MQRLSVAEEIDQPIWKLLSNYQGLPRVKSLLWLICKNRLPSNEERVRRCMALDPGCSICGVAVESISHILQDCVVACKTWVNVIKSELMGEFMELDMIKNCSIFDPGFSSYERVLHESCRLTTGTVRAREARREAIIDYRLCVDRSRCWEPPPV
ncbi:hypothetical protein F3Y22_tig00011079pilonHSYRG00246 [Hibiscus syriacus]|uniref:Reverse transcriptase zinc-binding domain-containing protein n=1 Tax=Hibiscus syriacus TaxID=106335 RepID=A0A6A3C4W0_HIBSY|nr:hypothetical protein F3Y22_tig00011079pilonHSYRG00246 [Hibiscus syriacus]